MKGSRASGLALLAVAMIPVAAATAHAQTVFPLDGGEGQTSFTQTVAGITLTVNNPIPNTISALPNFMLFGDTYTGFMKGFDLHFDADQKITEYTVGNVNLAGGAYFDLMGPNGNSLHNSLAAPGTFSLNGTFSLHAGEVGNLTSSFPNPNGYAELLSIGTVPEPGTYALLAGTAAGLAVLWSRQARPKRE